jgi:hypothetical protein
MHLLSVGYSDFFCSWIIQTWFIIESKYTLQMENTHVTKIWVTHMYECILYIWVSLLSTVSLQLHSEKLTSTLKIDVIHSAET